MRPTAPSPARSRSEKFLVRREPTAPKIQSRLPPRSTRARSLTILTVDFIGCLASVGLILLFQESATVLWIGSILLGVSLASIFPTFLTLAEERMHVTGSMTGWFLARRRELLGGICWRLASWRRGLLRGSAIVLRQASSARCWLSPLFSTMPA